MNKHLLSTTYIFILTAFLAGCSGQYQDNMLIKQKTAEAEQYLVKGQPQQAAQAMQQLDRQQIRLPAHQRLLAAEALLQSGDQAGAQKQLDAINPEHLDLNQLNIYKLLSGQLLLRSGDYRQALEQFNFIIPDQLSQRHKRSYFQSLAFAYSLNEQFPESVKTRIALSEFLGAPEAIENNNEAILEALTKLTTQELSTLEKTSQEPLKAWAALAGIVKANRVGTNRFNAAFARWQQRFPIHPGHSLRFDKYQDSFNEQIQQFSRVAVLLPESGPYAVATQAFKAGFNAAVDHPEPNTSTPVITYYNSDVENILGLYQQAVANGAELIIGPLQKHNIERLAQLGELPKPVLALNRVTGIAKNNLFQFGMTPEDEAEQVALKAFNDGHRRALVLVPNTALGQRIANAIHASWQQSGGIILEVQAYNPRQSDYTQPIKQLLRVREKNNPNARNTVTIRNDADVIFLSGRPREARSLYPQLIYYGARSIPVYATPQIYAGVVNPSRDMDLNDITFCDSPWLFEQNYSGPLGMENQRNNWRRISSAYLRLFAMGIDSFRLIPYLGALNSISYPGATGTLTLDDNNHINRELICARFREGIAEPLSQQQFGVNRNAPAPAAAPDTALVQPVGIE